MQRQLKEKERNTEMRGNIRQRMRAKDDEKRKAEILWSRDFKEDNIKQQLWKESKCGGDEKNNKWKKR